MRRSNTGFRPRSRPFGVLHNRSFLALWLGLLISSIGDWVNYVAMVAVVWGQTHSPLALAALRLFHIVPILIIAPLAGVFVDRWNRKWTLVGSAVVAGGSVGILTLAHPVPLVFLAYGFITTALAFFNPAQAAALPAIVAERDLVSANSLSQVGSTGSIVLGGLVGGLIVSQMGASAAFLIDALSFGAIALLVATVTFTSSSASAVRTSVWRELVEGIDYLRSEPFVRAIVIAGVIFVFAPATVLTLGFAFAGTTLHAGASGYGRILAGYGVGQGVGILFMLFVRNRLPHGVVFAGSGILLGLGDAALGLAHTVGVAAIAYGVAGFGSLANVVAAVTLLQRLVPDHIRGRIFSVSSTFDHAGAFASTLLVGLGAGIWSPGALIFVAGLAAAATGVLALPAMRSAALRSV